MSSNPYRHAVADTCVAFCISAFCISGELCEAVEGINAPAILRCCEDYLPEGMLEAEDVVEEGGGEEED